MEEKRVSDFGRDRDRKVSTRARENLRPAYMPLLLLHSSNWLSNFGVYLNRFRRYIGYSMKTVDTVNRYFAVHAQPDKLDRVTRREHADPVRLDAFLM